MIVMEIEEIESILNCPICMEEYDDPRILPCQHSFCEKCLSSYIKDLTKDKLLQVKSFLCPICRHKTKLRNNSNDASSYERDLTKAALLHSKHILLMQEDDPRTENDSCEAPTMATLTEDGHDISDLQAALDVSRNVVSSENHKDESGKVQSKRSRKRAIARNRKSKEKTRASVKKRRNNQPTDNVEDLNDDFDPFDKYLVKFVLSPLYTSSCKDSGKQLALFLVTILSATVIGFTYVAPYLSIFLFSFFALTHTKRRNILISYCKVTEAKMYDLFLFQFLQYSTILVYVALCLNSFVFTLSCMSTVSNALFKNDTVVSLQELAHNAIAYQSNSLTNIRVMDIIIYDIIMKIVNFVFFLGNI